VFVLNFITKILFTGFEGDLDTERKALLAVGHLNLALCHLKLQEYIEARDQCDKALKLNPTSEKGLFRRLVTKQYICACTERVKMRGDQKVSVHLMITIQKVTSNVQSVPCQSPDIY
jgi:Tfp pilus assembly protein PilF